MKHIFMISLCLILVHSIVLADNPDPTKFEPKYYENAKVIRVKYSSGETFVQRSYDEGLEEATINLPVFEKDKAGTTSGRLEFYLGRLNYLRLDFDTEVIFTEVPSLGKTNLNLRIIKGGAYLDIAQIDNEKDIEIQTPDCGVFLLDRGLYRINVSEAGNTEIYAYEGIAEVAGDDYSRNVHANQKTVMATGTVSERPFYFQASDRDGFDEWNEQRNRTIGYSRQSSSRYLESGYEDCEYELSHSGRWVYEPEYTNYVWIPYHIGSSWKPYWNGRWIWNPYYGYVWNSYDSWGWYTHYYGRWQWSSFYGWYWIPGYQWSPAWVSWFWGSSYYGWCPLSYWNRPFIVIHKKWLKNYHYRKGMPINASSSIIIRKNQLSASHINKVALRSSDLAKTSLRTLAFRGNAPRDRMATANVNVSDARGRTVQYKRSGLVSDSKIRTRQGDSFKYSRDANSSARPFQSSRSAQKERSSFRSTTSKSTFRSQDKSAERKVYRSSPKSTTTWKGTSSRKYSSSPAKRSSSGKSATKRKKDQPYFGSRTTSSSSVGQTRSSSNSSPTARKYNSSGYSASSTRFDSRTKSPLTYKSYRSQTTGIHNSRSGYPTQTKTTYSNRSTSPFKDYRSRTNSSPITKYRYDRSSIYRSTRSQSYPSLPYRTENRASNRSFSSQSRIRFPRTSTWNTTRSPYQTSRSTSRSFGSTGRSASSRASFSSSRAASSRSQSSRSSSSSGSSGRKKH
jgi:hypothetical protein